MSYKLKIEEIWELLNTLSEATQEVAVAKCKEIGFPTDQGTIPLNESFINLNASRLIIRDAVERKKLVNLPITVQKTLHEHLVKISGFLKGLTSGTNEVINLVEEIEKLNFAIWHFGLHTLSTEALGYLEKTNQIKKLEKELIDLKEKLENGLNLKKDLETLLENITNEYATIQKKTLSADENLTKIVSNATVIDNSVLEANKKLNSIADTEIAVDKLSNSISGLKEKGDVFSNDIEKIAKKSGEIINTINEQESKLISLTENTEKIYTRVQELLPGATSAGLASAFKERREAIAKTKEFWKWGVVISIMLLVGVAMYYVLVDPNKSREEWWEFLLHRFPFVGPLIWLGWFFSRNYGHTVRLEEDYAFKESISKSFEGYKKQMQEVDKEGSLKKLCDKIISILSEDPLRIFDRKTSDETPANSILERILPTKKPPQAENKKPPEN